MTEPVIPSGGSLADRLRAVDDIVARATEQLERLGRSDPRDVDAADRRAKAARSGQLGTDWQRVQQQIDLGRTSLAAVFDGTDTSPHAERLRQRSRRTLTQARSEDGRSSAADPASDALAGLDELRERLRDLTDRWQP